MYRARGSSETGELWAAAERAKSHIGGDISGPGLGDEVDELSL